MAKGVFIYGNFDSLFIREFDMRIFLIVEVYDDIMEMPQHISADVTDEIHEIYKGTELTKEFVRTIESKFKDVIGKNAIVMEYNDQKEWVLDRKVKELFYLWLLKGIIKIEDF